MANAPITLNTRQRLPLSVSLILDDSTRAIPDATPVWESDDTTVVQLNRIDADGARIFADGMKVGTATITVTVGSFNKSIDITVVAPPAPATIDLDIVATLPIPK